MKSKLLFTLLTSISSFTLNAATPIVGGTVTFMGQIVNSTCSVSNASSNIMVNLGQYDLNRLSKAGDISQPIPFEIKLDDKKILPTFHPAALLRDETKKIDFWNDLKKIVS